ncbi:MAG: thioredoxin [Omnitrophica WOR_2 bacterium RIFCSPLOWO2_02_FULL_63_16]|nr:MAG: thioredoxin [Omnitrophica WOR_2 bacterium GWA2_63_20]OGX17930.1 MAG: thioredoxin [Omnitrophica WOR_2 bacterium GWF2_63_9]OGX32644.1 MAG: thioredoxin [Omnitrophica WOR_2 bacterium RIFCSPHIGHO2_12_FULL_64_13]OGX44456.1 MAG: thioredoxin [Omnitrophica WOR_2 bacterium RIFCSPLOWO2_02_FULL_63_16]OGX50060.1 MAG: thioredoxin [Omnitrophica WOR_2 bacterium RIFCSPLOWO2_12_FULL_63_16]HAM40634.1 thioredoxin [Candidatus Omnitrophota bacterium]
MAGGVIELTDKNFAQHVLNASTPALVDMWAAWCSPCRMIAPVIEELAGKYQGKVTFGKLNVDDHPSLAAQYQIMNIPTLLIFKGGREADRIVGVQPKEELISRLDTLLT